MEESLAGADGVYLGQAQEGHTARSLLVHAEPVAGVANCSFELRHDTLRGIDTAVKQAGCTEVELWLHMPLALLDTAALATSLPSRVTIRGIRQPTDDLPTLQVNPHGRLPVKAGSRWQIKDVEISLVSFDWFESQSEQAEQAWPAMSGGAVAEAEPVRVEVINSTLQCPRCADVYSDGMGASWLEAFGGRLDPEPASGRVGVITNTNWLHPGPWGAASAASPGQEPYQWLLNNVSVTCARDDVAMGRMAALPFPPVPQPANSDSAAAVAEGPCFHAADRGESYRGAVSVSESGRPCVRWGLLGQPAGANVLSPAYLPDSGLDVPACRNPLGMFEKPWCYVEGAPFIERCAVPMCVPPPPAAPGISAASSRWITLLAILISIAGLLLIALLIVVLVKIMHGTWTCSAVATKATPTRTCESVSSAGAGRKLSEVTTVMSTRSAAQHAAAAGPTGSAPSQSSMSRLSRQQSSHGGGGGGGGVRVGSPADTEQRAAVELSVTIVDSHIGDTARQQELVEAGSSPIGRMPPSEAELSVQSPGSQHHMHGSIGAGPWGGPAPSAHLSDPSAPRHPLHNDFIHHPHHAPRQRSPDYRHMPNVASPTLQHLIARADSVRSSGAAQPPAPAPAPRPNSAGSTVFPHAHVAHVHARSAAVRKLLLEAETRPHAVEEALAIWNSTDPSQIRAVAMSDTRSHATSSRSDFIQSMHAASGAVNTTPSRATDVHHTDFSASVVDSGTVPETDRSAGGAVPGGPGGGPLTSSTFSGPVPRPWHTAHMRRVGEPEYGMSASWEYAAASPTGTHASRVAPHSHGYSGAAEGAVPHEFGPPSHSGYYHSVHQSVSSKSETFQSDSLTSLYQVNLKDHDIKIGKVLGRGSFAQVYQGLWNDTAVAIKVIEYKEGSRDAVNPTLEASLTKELTHPNVVITYDFGWIGHEVNSLLSVRPESAAMVILMEYCNLKSLSTNIRYTNRFGHLTGPLKWSAIAHALIDVLRGLKYLHEVDIVHGDIKGANVMLKSVHKSVSPVKFTAKLADLGLAQLRGNAIMEGAVGSLTHAAPELLDSRGNTTQSDIYAFGVLMYEVISGKEPFKDSSVHDLIQAKTTTPTAQLLPMDPGDDAIHAAFVQVFQQCVHSNPADRPSSTELFNRLRSIANNANLFSRDSTAHYKQIKVDSVGSPIKGPRADLIFGAKRTSSQSSRWSRSPSSADAMAFGGAGYGGGSVAMFPPEPYSGGFPRRPGSLASAGGHPARPPRSPRSSAAVPNLNSAGSTGLAPSSADSIPRGESQHLYSEYARSPTGDGRPHGPFHPRSGPSGLYGGAISPTFSDRSPLIADHRPRTYPGSHAAAALPDPRLTYMSGPFSDQSAAEWTAAQFGHSPGPPPRYGASAESSHAPQQFAAQQHAQHAQHQQQFMLHGVHTMPPLNFYGRVTPATSAGSMPVSGPASGGSVLAHTPDGRPVSAGSAHMMLDHRQSTVHSAAHRLGPRGLSWAGDAQSASGDAASPSGRGGAQSPSAPSGGAIGGRPGGTAPAVRPGIPYSSVFSNPTAQMDDGEETVPEEGDTTSDESRSQEEERANGSRRKAGKQLTELESAQKALLDEDSGESLPERRQQQSGSVDSFNLDLGNSSNLQRLLQKQRGAGKGGEGSSGGVITSGGGGPGPSQSSQFAVDDARRVAGTTIPEASTMDGPIDAVPPAAPQPRRRQPRPAVIGRTRSGIRSSSGGGSAKSGGVTRTETVDSALGTPGGDELPSAIHSTNTVTLNLWGAHSFQHSLMHDSRDAVDASFATDAEGAYPVQSIMESMRRMASLAGGNSSAMQRASGGVSNMSGSGRLGERRSAAAERSTESAEAAPPRPPLHATAVADVCDALLRTPSLPSARANDSRSHNTSSVSFTKTHDADHASTEAPGSASAVPPSPVAATQTFPRTPRTSSYTHSLSLTPSSTSRQPQTSHPHSFFTSAVPIAAPHLHAAPAPDSPRPAHQHPAPQSPPPPKILFAPGGKHAQQLSSAPLNAAMLRSMDARGAAGHSSVSRYLPAAVRRVAGVEEETVMQGVSAWLMDLQPNTPPSPPASPPPGASPVSGADSVAAAGRHARPKSHNDDRGKTRTAVAAASGAAVERSGRMRTRGGDRAKARTDV